MNLLRSIGIYLLSCIFSYLWLPIPAFSQTAPDVSATSTERDGQHDFDFEIGTWKSHISRRCIP